jgi:glycoside/pentoside/hexuronide:cation symporter, GPH family
MTTPSSRLPLRTRVGYGVADFGVAGATLVLQLYLFEYYTVVVGLSPWLVGGVMAVALLWDAVSDPLMGLVCDRTRSRWGRFFPWMLGGAAVLGLAFAMLFHPPAGAGTVLAAGWLLLSCLLVNTGLTLLGVPHLALGGALSRAARSAPRSTAGVSSSARWGCWPGSALRSLPPVWAIWIRRRWAACGLRGRRPPSASGWRCC